MENLYLACRDCRCRLPLEVTNRSQLGQQLLEGGEVEKLMPDFAPLKAFLADHRQHRTELAGEDDTMGYRGDLKVLPQAEELVSVMRGGSKEERLEAAQLGRSRPECAETLARLVLGDRAPQVQEAAASSLLHLVTFERLDSGLVETLLARLEKKDPPVSLGELLRLLLERDTAAAASAEKRLVESLHGNPKATLQALSGVPLAFLVPAVVELLPLVQAGRTLVAWGQKGLELSALDAAALENYLDTPQRDLWLELLAYAGEEGRRRLRREWLGADPRKAERYLYFWERAMGPAHLPALEGVELEETGVTQPAHIADWSQERIPAGDWVSALAFSADGTRLALGTGDGRVLVTPDLGELAEPHQGPVSTLAFSPDGRYLVSGAWDGKLAVRELEGEVEWRWVHFGRLAGVGFLDDRRFFSVDRRRLALWGLEPLRLGVAGEAFVHRPHQAVVSPDRDWLLVTTDSDATVHMSESGELMSRLFPPSSASILSGAFSPDGLQAAGGTLNGQAILWTSLDHQKPAEVTWEAHTGAVRALVWGRCLVTTGVDSAVRFWSPQGQLLAEQAVPDQGLALALHPGGRKVAVGHAGGEALVLTLP